MSRSIFGWSYPPGAANDPNAPYNQTDDGPCVVCAQPIDDCICPECPVCGEPGNPKCYRIDGLYPPMGDLRHLDPNDRPDHGLQRSLAQVVLAAEAERQWAEHAAAEDAYYRELEEADRIAEANGWRNW